MTTVADPEYLAVADAVRRQQRPQALELAARAAAKGSRHPLVLVLAAEHLEAKGQLDGALNLLRIATDVEPRRKVTWVRMGAVLAKKGAWVEGAKAFEQALALAPDDVPALMGAGEMHLMRNDLEVAERYYTRAVEVDPRAAQALAVLAVMAGQRRDPARARELALRASGLQPGIIGAEMALARADLLDDHPEAADERMTRLLARSDLTEDQRVGGHDIRASARDALDRPADAFSDYEARNNLEIRRHAARFGGEGPERPVQLARGLAAFLAETPDEAWLPPDDPDPAPDEPRSHVFLVGFPRSGTTLLEKSLAGAPGVVVLEEVNRLAEASVGLREDEAAWRRLVALSPEQAAASRAIYWAGVRETLGEIGGTVLVDKLPLHTQHLPVIAKLFPRAKILFALRDPRDVVLSCFRRRFLVNAAMYEFLTLKGAAEFYDAIMNLALTARAHIRFDAIPVHHEKLIDEFEERMRTILRFIGADWSDAVLDFSARLGGRQRTPSYAQLSRGLNSEGVGQWRRYAAEMGEALPLLEPWVAAHGYGQ